MEDTISISRRLAVLGVALVLLGLLTGNVAPGAELKLRSAAIDPDYIPLGAPLWIETNGDTPLRRADADQPRAVGRLARQPVHHDVAEQSLGVGLARRQRHGQVRQAGTDDQPRAGEPGGFADGRGRSRADGGSRAWVNGSPAAIGVLARLGALVVDIRLHVPCKYLRDADPDDPDGRPAYAHFA